MPCYRQLRTAYCLPSRPAKDIFRDGLLDYTAIVLQSTALADRMPGTYFLQLRHDLDELIHEHLHQPPNRIAFGLVVNGGCGLHQLDHSRALQDERRDRAVVIDQ